MDLARIEKNAREIIAELPTGVILVAAGKTRTAEEVQAAIQGGIKIIGYNYLQEAEKMYQLIGRQVQWHMIGHLQRNKVKKAITLFDMIETVDSLPLAEEIDRQCVYIGKKIPILIEVNSGKEENKNGVFPENVEKLIRDISLLPNIKIMGLMTMGPFLDDPEKLRVYFRLTRDIYQYLATAHIPNIELKYLSMGMSDSYQVAIEEGANMVRIGTKLFGERNESS
jgi:pyridoxal phosphate enzyme (YggS family)